MEKFFRTANAEAIDEITDGMRLTRFSPTLNFQHDLIALRMKATACNMPEQCITEIDRTFCESVAALRACSFVVRSAGPA